MNKGAYFEVVLWENFLDCMSREGLQSEYNKAAKECDIFVMLFCTKVGMYTKEEFETAFGKFQETNKPKIFTYFKNIEKPLGEIKPDDMKSLRDFQAKLKELKHYQTKYLYTAELFNHFYDQLEKLKEIGYIQWSINAETPPHSTTQALPLLHDLTPPPFKPSYFIGRDDELKTIHDKLFTDNPLLLLVNGEGGIGKTSLASEYYRRHRNEYKHIAWLVYQNSITDTLIQLSKSLDIVFEETASSKERLDAVLTKMANIPEPSLLVIDNANELEDLQKHQNILQCYTNFHILITTRACGTEIAEYRIESLDHKEALQVFEKHHPNHKETENELFTETWKAVGGNTQVIEILAKNIAELNRKKSTYSLQDMVNDIQSKGLLEIKENKEMTSTKPTELISAMYEIGDLSPQEIHLLSIFAVLPPERIEYDVLETLLRAFSSLNPTLDSLSSKGWLEFNQDSHSYKCSPVIQEIVKNKNINLTEDCELLVNSLIELLDYEANSGHLLHCSFEEASIYARYAISAMKDIKATDTNSGLLYDRMGSYFQTTGNLPKAQEYYEEETEWFEELVWEYPQTVGYKNGLAISYSKLGDTYTATGTLPKAQEYYEQYNQLSEELVREYPQSVEYKYGLAISYSKLGEVYSATGNLPNKYDTAMSYFKKAERLWIELVKLSPNYSEFQENLVRIRKEIEELK